MQTVRARELVNLEYIKQLSTLVKLYEIVAKLPQDNNRKRKVRTRKSNLPYHKRRKRVDWHQWVRELGPDDFYTHHRMTRSTFEKLLRIIGGRLQTDHRKVRYGSGPVTPRMQLTMCLKFLGGDSTHDIKKHMGGEFEFVFVCVCVNIIKSLCVLQLQGALSASAMFE